MVSRTERTAEKQQEAFLLALSETANVSRSCEKAGIPRRTAYDWRAADEAFAKAWDAAVDLGTEALIDEVKRRAFEGTLKPVYQGGKKVGQIREFSDTLAIFLLKGLRPETFKDRVANEHSGPDGGPLVIERRIVDPSRD